MTNRKTTMKLYLVTLLLIGGSIAVSGQTLKSLAEKHGKYIGIAVAANHLSEAGFTTVLDREIDSITPENEMKWGSVANTRGATNYGPADQIVSHAQMHGQKMRGHTLIWHSQLPGWVENGNMAAADLRKVISDHIASEVGHYKGKIYAWDVVNEIITDNDGTIRNDVFFRTLGKSYVAEAFKLAHEADPAAKLYINDYNIEGVNQKSTAVYNLVKELLAEGAPVHGVGFQSHFTAGHVPTDFKANLERFAALGVDVAITELDIGIQGGATAATLQTQANDYGHVFETCLSIPKCVGVTIWGLTDKYSWRKETHPLPWDDQYKDKPAVTAIKNALSK